MKKAVADKLLAQVIRVADALVPDDAPPEELEKIAQFRAALIKRFHLEKQFREK